jgi:hypothetical protein
VLWAIDLKRLNVFNLTLCRVWRFSVQLKLSAALKEYRLLHGSQLRSPGALIYPSSLRYLAAYVLGLLKSTAFRCAAAALGEAREPQLLQLLMVVSCSC